MSTPSLPTIVVAEDDSDDLFFLKRGLSQAGIQNPVLAFENGRSAVEFLQRIDQEPTDDPVPEIGLVLLDIKMPLMSGLEVLEWARKQPGLAKTPIVMLSGSTAVSDIARARDLGANDYVIKPATVEMLGGVVRRALAVLTRS